MSSKIGFLGFVTLKFQSALFVFQKLSIFVFPWHQSPAFPRLAPANCFPVLGTDRPFCRAWHRLHAFPYFGPFARQMQTQLQLKEEQIVMNT